MVERKQMKSGKKKLKKKGKKVEKISQVHSAVCVDGEREKQKRKLKQFHKCVLPCVSKVEK